MPVLHEKCCTAVKAAIPKLTNQLALFSRVELVFLSLFSSTFTTQLHRCISFTYLPATSPLLVLVEGRK